jgi:hypothetical protein
MIQIGVKKIHFSHDCDLILWNLKGMRFKCLIPSLQKTLYDSIINTICLMQVREKKLLITRISVYIYIYMYIYIYIKRVGNAEIFYVERLVHVASIPVQVFMSYQMFLYLALFACWNMAGDISYYVTRIARNGHTYNFFYCKSAAWYLFLAEIGRTASSPLHSGFGGLGVSMLASGTQVRGFKPGRSVGFLRAEKSSACLPSEGK